MLKVSKERDEGAEPKVRDITFAEMIRSEVRVERWMKEIEILPLEEVTLSDTVLEVSTFNYFFMIEGDWIVLWVIIY